LARTAEEISDYITETVLAEATLVCRETINDRRTIMRDSQAEKAERFQALHARPGGFVIPNPWDVGTARILTGLGFEALTTTSAGLAFTWHPLDQADKAQITRISPMRAARVIMRIRCFGG
jgi:2-methylisocitrate lyase-like PEP mutase family enzyme